MFQSFLLINLKLVTWVSPGPETHKRTWCSTWNKNTKGKDKKFNYSILEFMESSSQNLYSFKLLANDIENFPNFVVYIYNRQPCTSTMWLSPLKVKMLTMQGWLGSLQVSREKLNLFIKYLYTMLEASNPYYLNIVNITFTSSKIN